MERRMIKILQQSFLIGGCLTACLAAGTLLAQTKTPRAYWVTETLDISDQAAFLKAVPAVAPTVAKFGGRYIVLGGKISAHVGPEPKRITIIEFDSPDKAREWIADPTAEAARSEVNKYAKVRNYIVEGAVN
jgi:uncharacterized protein (DUF1330 family)